MTTTAITTSESLWPRLRNFIAGYGSGCALVLAGHPFDLLKVSCAKRSSKTPKIHPPLPPK